MSNLVLRCAFVAHSYQGVRLRPDHREELDWPPSPARLHQALVAAAMTGIPPYLRKELTTDALDALRWLEKLHEPDLVASALSDDSESATHFRLAIPQNNPAKADLTETSTLLLPTLRRRAVSSSGDPLKVDYVWHLDSATGPSEARKHFSALADLVAKVRYLGRAEDQIEAQLDMTDYPWAEVDPRQSLVWRPTNAAGDEDLWVPRLDTTDDLLGNHALAVPERTRKPLARRFFRSQGYSCKVVAALTPVYTAIFQLVPETGDPDELPLSCDAESAGVWRSRIRQEAVACALDDGRWDDPALAQELITGHPPGQPEPTGSPHLAFVPVPSVSSHGMADGRVRRFALLGYARAEVAAQAVEVYRVLCASLNGNEIEAGWSRYRLQLLAGRPEMDKAWYQFLRSGRVWHSVTPVAIARGFKVPVLSRDGLRKLTSNERHLRKLAEWTALFRASLLHIGLPQQLASTCLITLTPSPLVPNTSRAENYRPPGESAILTHARLEFSEPVRGPLVVGDRRYKGYGLLIPY